ncbi:histidine phosphatase family protein [Mobilicoccus massiliensis]|uniref:histidine phosphatase family protein n=1 Tax=Mobilicoccus massiliensis TaxID=1522310 RepID=UPI00058E8EBF|nr:histidine phosphatase family protein [Mobilicoccus massiliensis]
MTRTLVHLVRHGEVENPGRVLYGRLPGYHLSARGRRMAERLAEYFHGADLAAVTASPMERAQETAAPTARDHGLEVRTDSRLIEAGNHFEGSTIGSNPRQLLHPKYWGMLLNPFLPSWGESYESVARRMTAAVEAARDFAAGHEIVLVSHELPVWTLRSSVEGRRLWHDPRRRECTLASVTTLAYHGKDLTSLTYVEPCADL